MPRAAPSGERRAGCTHIPTGNGTEHSEEDKLTGHVWREGSKGFWEERKKNKQCFRKQVKKLLLFFFKTTEFGLEHSYSSIKQTLLSRVNYRGKNFSCTETISGGE